MMCLNVWNSFSEAHKLVALQDLPYFILDETGFIDFTSSFTCSAEKQYEPSTCYKFPVVLMRDVCEDGSTLCNLCVL